MDLDVTTNKEENGRKGALKSWWGKTQLRHSLHVLFGNGYKVDEDCNREGNCPKKGVPCVKKPEKSVES